MLKNVNWSDLYCNGEKDPLIAGDVTFKVVDLRAEDDVKYFEAHKLLLATVSPVFKEKLLEDADQEEKPLSGGSIFVEGTTPRAFETMLKHLYCVDSKLTDFMNVSDGAALASLFDVLVLADKYQLEELIKTCEDIITTSVLITEENLFTVMRLSSASSRFMYVNSSLKESCKKFVNEKVNKHGYDFLQVLLAQPNYNADAFQEICSMKEDRKRKRELDDDCNDSGMSELSQTNSSIFSSNEKRCWLM